MLHRLAYCHYLHYLADIAMRPTCFLVPSDFVRYNLNPPPGIIYRCAGSSVFGRSGRSDAIEDRVRVRAFISLLALFMHPNLLCSSAAALRMINIFFFVLQFDIKFDADGWGGKDALDLQFGCRPRDWFLSIGY